MQKSFDDLLIENCVNYKTSGMELPFLLGTDQINEPAFLDMHNYILHGYERTGKTNIINLIISSSMFLKDETILYYLFDSHHSEFKRYRNFSNVKIIAHNDNLLKPLNSLVEALNKRIELFSKCKVANIQDYNKKYTPIPYIVIVIDDFLSMNFSKEHIIHLEELLRIGKTLGIKVICSIQRKSYIKSRMKSEFLEIEIETSTDFKTKIYTSFDSYKIVTPFIFKEGLIYNILSREFKWNLKILRKFKEEEI